MNRFLSPGCGYMEQQSCCRSSSHHRRLPCDSQWGWNICLNRRYNGVGAFPSQRTKYHCKTLCSKSNLYSGTCICLCHSSSATEFRFWLQTGPNDKRYSIYSLFGWRYRYVLFVAHCYSTWRSPPRYHSTWQIVPFPYPVSLCHKGIFRFPSHRHWSSRKLSA